MTAFITTQIKFFKTSRKLKKPQHDQRLPLKLAFGVGIFTFIHGFNAALAKPVSAVNISEFPAVKALQKKMPGTVQAFILRKAECLHWQAQQDKVYDSGHQELITHELEKAQCSSLHIELKKLKETYLENKKVTDILNKTQNLEL